MLKDYNLTEKQLTEIHGLTIEQITSLKNIENCITKAVNSWVNYNNSHGTKRDNSNYWYNKALRLAENESMKKGYIVKFDYPGLYPTYEIIDQSTNEKYTEYNGLNFFKRINNFWK
jgi:hypothetical protein